jgi:hypothetical protein
MFSFSLLQNFNNSSTGGNVPTPLNSSLTGPGEEDNTNVPDIVSNFADNTNVGRTLSQITDMDRKSATKIEKITPPSSAQTLQNTDISPKCENTVCGGNMKSPTNIKDMSPNKIPTNLSSNKIPTNAKDLSLNNSSPSDFTRVFKYENDTYGGCPSLGSFCTPSFKDANGDVIWSSVKDPMFNTVLKKFMAPSKLIPTKDLKEHADDIETFGVKFFDNRSSLDFASVISMYDKKGNFNKNLETDLKNELALDKSNCVILDCTFENILYPSNYFPFELLSGQDGSRIGLLIDTHKCKHVKTKGIEFALVFTKVSFFNTKYKLPMCSMIPNTKQYQNFKLYMMYHLYKEVISPQTNIFYITSEDETRQFKDFYDANIKDWKELQKHILSITEVNGKIKTTLFLGCDGEGKEIYDKYKQMSVTKTSEPLLPAYLNFMRK